MPNTADILKGLNLIGELALKAREAYEEHREIARKMGIPDSDLDAADARFAKVFDFSAKPDSPSPKTPGDYDVVFPSKPDDSDYSTGDRVFSNADGSAWRVEAKDGKVVGWGAGWSLDHTVT